MRLVCPNCDAQYEVPDDVMSPDGREVQCSSCGQTWFQQHPDNQEETTPDNGSVPQEDEDLVVTRPEAEEDYSSDAVAVEEADTVDLPGIDPTVDADTPEATPHPARRELDPAIANVLQAEAELEQQARRNELDRLESQPELGLTEQSGEDAQRKQEARDRMARLRGEPTEDEFEIEDSLAVEDTSAIGSRRDLLPDIEEINSTLRSNDDRSPDVDPGQTAQVERNEKRSARRGFTLTIALFAILVLLYVFAPNLSQAFPPVEPMLSGYIALIDSGRNWLDGQIESMLNWLDKAALSSSK